MATLEWRYMDARSRGATKPRHQWCADGEGFVVVRQRQRGYCLYDQGDFVRVLGQSLDAALTEAEQYMVDEYAAMYDDLVTI